MSEPRTKPRWGWWVTASLAFCLLAAGLRVGLPLYRRNVALARLERLGCDVGTTSRRPEWLVRRDRWGWTAGSDSVVRVWWDPFYRRSSRTLSPSDIDELLSQVRVFRELKELGLRDVGIEEHDLEILEDLPHLEFLLLAATPIRGDGLAHVAESVNLTALDLSETEIDDPSLAHIGRLMKLETLRLDRTRISDAGLKHLAKLPNLRELSVSNTAVTEAGLDELLKSHPALSVSDD